MTGSGLHFKKAVLEAKLREGGLGRGGGLGEVWFLPGKGARKLFPQVRGDWDEEMGSL